MHQKNMFFIKYAMNRVHLSLKRAKESDSSVFETMVEISGCVFQVVLSIVLISLLRKTLCDV